MRDQRLTIALTALAAAIAATGVGAALGPGTAPSDTDARASATAAAAAKAPNGRVLVRKNCGGCHTMKAAGIYGRFGPNLDRTKPTKAEVVKFVRKGGQGMPAYATLTKAQVNAIATYVATKTRPPKRR